MVTVVSFENFIQAIFSASSHGKSPHLLVKQKGKLPQQQWRQVASLLSVLCGAVYVQKML